MPTLDNAHALIIGVGNDLPGTVRDAVAINNILADERFSGYKPENIILVTEKEATRDGILKGFDTIIERTDENSSVLLYYSGHGGWYEPWDQFYLVPNNFDKVEYENTWVKAEELKEKLQAIQSRKLIFFLDCCHAAGMTKSGGDLGDEPEEKDGSKSLEHADGLAQKIDDGKGMCIISSCREDQKSYIMAGDVNSLFTLCLIDVLKGKHKTQFDEPFVRIYEVCQYIFKKVPERNPDQRPYANLQIYDDFILSYIPEEYREERHEALASNTVEADKAPTEEVVTTFRKNESANSAILFVHGFFGEGANTFGKIPQYLMEDEDMDGWDMYPMGYSEYVKPKLGKHIWASIDDIERIADYLATSIKHKYARYERVAIVAHSLGGLVAQRAIVKLNETDRSRISHVLLFACPSDGIESETLSEIWKKRLKDLSKKGAFISTLRKDWKSQFSEGYPFKLKVACPTHDEYIAIESCRSVFDPENIVTVAGGHFDLVQPTSKENDSYKLITSLLTGNTFFNKYTSEEDINLTLGEYSAVIQKLLPIVEELDTRGFQQLIFALEGMDRGEEAMTLLEDHLTKETNSSVLGLLGGRYKRRYLLNHRLADGEESLKYYQRIYDDAVAKKNHKMLYYSAINLAFLHLMLYKDYDMMNQFATEANNAASKDVFDNIWKIATLAEGNLYLGQLDEAREYYAKAAKKAGIREKMSIHLNAHKAYSCLMECENPEDEFHQFLEEHFLY